jgi:hypothetical protein
LFNTTDFAYTPKIYNSRLYTKSCNLYIELLSKGFCYLYSACQKTKDRPNSQQMRKCAILFLILIMALIFAAVSEKNSAELNSDWNSVVAKK